MSYTNPHIQSSALVTIDTQADFTRAGAPAEIPGTNEVLPNIVRLLSWYRKNDLPIIHVIRLYQTDGSNVDICRRERIESGKPIAAPGTSGAELVDELKPSPGFRLDAEVLLKGKPQYWSDREIVIYKSRWGAFYRTSLEDIIRGYGVDTLVFCGCNFPNCPRTSIYEASERDFRTVLIQDAVSQLYEMGIQELRAIGVDVVKTDEFLSRANGEGLRTDQS